MSRLARATRFFIVLIAIFFTLPISAQAILHFSSSKPGA